VTTTTEIPTDLVTPLGAYLHLRAQAPHAFLLESVERGRLGRHSFVGCGTRVCTLAEAEQEAQPAVGIVSYDWITELEPTVQLPVDGPKVPPSLFLVPELVIRFDHALGVAEILHGEDGAAAQLSRGVMPRPPAPAEPRAQPTRRLPDAAAYGALVERAKGHIRDGDVFQVVLSQRAERATGATPIGLYRALRRINPSPYLFLLELDGFALVGSSPETLVKADGRRASLNPIAGTTPRGPGDAERLLESEKDRAEHVMLVDLGRNDLARVCTPGTVRVERFLDVEPYSHVTHLVSQVDGELRDDVTHFDLLRACFPAGTVSGAPKIRAMQLISELEGYRRGAYAGAVGYVMPAHGTLDTCIAIRTILLRDGVAFMQAGAGIVVDSDPRAEHAECLDKLAAVEAAIDLAETSDA
jgi:anthranilate synthase component I